MRVSIKTDLMLWNNFTKSSCQAFTAILELGWDKWNEEENNSRMSLQANHFAI